MSKSKMNLITVFFYCTIILYMYLMDMKTHELSCSLIDVTTHH